MAHTTSTDTNTDVWQTPVGTTNLTLEVRPVRGGMWQATLVTGDNRRLFVGLTDLLDGPDSFQQLADDTTTNAARLQEDAELPPVHRIAGELRQAAAFNFGPHKQRRS